jgi:hypothetical protein
MTDQSPTDPARLPHPPEAILGLLRRAEASLDDLDAVRAEIRAVREALESAEEPELATVAAAVALSGEGTLTVSVSITASGSGSGNTERTASGLSPCPPEPEARRSRTGLRAWPSPISSFAFTRLSSDGAPPRRRPHRELLHDGGAVSTPPWKP